MRHIEKQEEPEFFARYKRRRNAVGVWGANDKEWRETRMHLGAEILEKEQGHLCCYCESGIDADQTDQRSIEHIRPRQKFPSRRDVFDYQNLLVSCASTEHCNNIRGSLYDQNLFVSPLKEDCSSYFHYSGRGEISATQENAKKPAAEWTIRVLGLANKNLTAKRNREIRAVEIELTYLCEEEEYPERIEHYRRQCHLDTCEDGRLLPHCSSILAFLDSLLSGVEM